MALFIANPCWLREEHDAYSYGRIQLFFGGRLGREFVAGDSKCAFFLFERILLSYPSALTCQSMLGGRVFQRDCCSCLSGGMSIHIHDLRWHRDPRSGSLHNLNEIE
jgi:hypothetical protein